MLYQHCAPVLIFVKSPDMLKQLTVIKAKATKRETDLWGYSQPLRLPLMAFGVKMFYLRDFWSNYFSIRFGPSCAVVASDATVQGPYMEN